MNRTALVYGLIGAVLTAAWTLLEFRLGWHTTRAEIGSYTGFIALIFPLVLIWRMLAPLVLHGTLTYGRAVGLAVLQSGVAAVAQLPFWWFYSRQLNSAYPFNAELVTTIMVGGLVIGALIGLVEAVILRRRTRSAEIGV